MDVHLIADNYATHKTALIRNWFAKRPRFQIHFTPTSASWLNLVERWFGLLTEKRLRRGVHQSSGELEAAIYRYLDVTNEDPKPLVWTKTADQILASVARFRDGEERRGAGRVPTHFRYRTLVLQRRFLNLVSFWPEIASRKPRTQSCQARGQAAMERCSRPLSCEASL